PPVGVVPGHHVEARALRRIVDAHREHIVLTVYERLARIKRERRVAALVVTEIRAVQPDVGEVVDAAELQRHRLAGEALWRREMHAIPAVGRPSRRWQVNTARHVDGLPLAVVEARQLPPGSLALDGFQRLGARS